MSKMLYLTTIYKFKTQELPFDMDVKKICILKKDIYFEWKKGLFIQYNNNK